MIDNQTRIGAVFILLGLFFFLFATSTNRVASKARRRVALIFILVGVALSVWRFLIQGIIGPASSPVR